MPKNNNPPVNETETKKKSNFSLSLSMPDMLGFGMNLVKSGLNLKQSINMTIDKKMSELVQKGSHTKEEAAQTGEKLKLDLGNSIDNFSGRMSDGIRSTLNRLNIATLDDVRSLEKQLDTLLEELESFEKSGASAKKKSASKKPPKSAPSPSKTSKKTDSDTKKPTKTPRTKKPRPNQQQV